MRALIRSQAILLVAFAFAGGATSAHAVDAASTPSPEAAACAPVEWPFSRKGTVEEHVELMKATPRSALVHYLFGEVTSPRRGPTAYFLARYLEHTEMKESLRAFFALVAWGAELEDEKSTPRKLELAELCARYQQALAAD